MENKQNHHHNLFYLLPIEITQIILGLTKEWLGIAAQCCNEWRSLIVTKLSNTCSTPPKLFVRTILQSISLIEWARDNGCPWNENTFNLGARTANLSVIQYLHHNACPHHDREA